MYTLYAKKILMSVGMINSAMQRPETGGAAQQRPAFGGRDADVSVSILTSFASSGPGRRGKAAMKFLTVA